MRRPALSRSDEAYRVLEEQIVTMAIEPGRIETEQELSVAAGFGRTPVREAVQRLERDMLVRIFPRRGILIEPIDVQSLHAIWRRIGYSHAARHPDRPDASARLHAKLARAVADNDQSGIGTTMQDLTDLGRSIAMAIENDWQDEPAALRRLHDPATSERTAH